MMHNDQDALRRVSPLLLDLFMSDAADMMAEVHSLTGYSQAEYATLGKALLNADFVWNADARRMMANAVLNLRGYPHGLHDDLADKHDLDAAQLDALWQAFSGAA
jgi:hypothetical protein